MPGSNIEAGRQRKRGRSEAFWLGLLMGCALAWPASAQVAMPGASVNSETCFVRRYDDRHLSRNRGQKTVAMRVLLRREVIPGSVGVPPSLFIRLESLRRGETRPWRAIGTCVFDRNINQDGNPDAAAAGKWRIASYARREGWGCNITGEHLDAEGGDLILDPSGEALVVHIADSITMRRSARVTGDEGAYIEFGGQDGVFRLMPAPEAACADLREAIRYE